MPTIDDVSRLANVSRATVSRVLTGTRGVREESREAVLRAVEELNYRPSFAAQNLASQSSSYVGLVLSAKVKGAEHVCCLRSPRAESVE